MKKRVADWNRRRHPIHKAFGPPHNPGAAPSGNRKAILVLGNCQARSMAACLQALNRDVVAKGVELELTGFADRFARRDRKLHWVLSQYDHILVQPSLAPLIRDYFPDLFVRVLLYPALNFSAYHPDLVYIHVKSTESYMFGPLGHYNSAIAFWGFTNGLSVAETVELFNGWTYEALGYFDFWQSSRQALLSHGEAADFSLASYLDTWSRDGCFMHSINHPMLFVLADIAKEILSRLGLPTIPAAIQYLPDDQADGPVWPIYPEVGERLGIEGHYHFKMQRGLYPADRPVVMLNLEEFVTASFGAFARHAKDDLVCERLAFENFRTLGDALAQRRVANSDSIEARDSPPSHVSNAGDNPYRHLPARQFWRSAVAAVPVDDVDPVVSGKFQFSNADKIATAGSCFAQHISKTLQKNGLNYYVAEVEASLAVDEARRRNYGVYSARYGNLYTARQLLQLFERAYGTSVPLDSAWLRADGRYVDPFRPQIEPDGHGSAEAVAASRELHFIAVRQMFESMDVLVFTLGLTEGWRRKKDGAVFPLAPGVAGGQMDYSRYEYVNFEVQDVVEDLERFLRLLQGVNPRARIVVTVSPVPLIATYERQHVLVATTYSKSVLRVAANDICARFNNCAYFPSYEIVTGNYARGAYFEPDLRTVTGRGVDHVMGLFLKHYCGEQRIAEVDGALLREFDQVNDIVCDEEAIDHR
jgi:hypothetical protein